MKTSRFLVLVAALVVIAAAAFPLAAQQPPIKIGEINSFSGIGAPFTGPYRSAVEMAVEEINAKGGVLGRKVEVLFRDDKGQPAEAVKHAQELVASEKVALVSGSFLSNVGLAVSDWAKQNKTLVDAAAEVGAVLAKNPDALYVSLFGSDWLAFVREAQKRGLFQKMFVVGILLGEPEYIDPLKTEAPEGMLVTGYPWYDIQQPAHKDFVARFTKKTDHNPVLGSLVGYVTYLSIFEAIKKAGGTDTEKLVAAFRDLKVETPIGPIGYRAVDGQSTMGAWVGMTKIDAKRGVGIMINHEYVAGEKVLPSPEEVKKLRSGG